MFDVFYIGHKPNLFPHEQSVESLEQAKQLSRTRYCWVINYLLDYSNFDFLWEPVPWQQQYTHVWPTSWEQFFGTHLIPKHTENIEFHYHDKAVPSKKFPQNFKVLIDRKVDFDFDWTPHPWEPPYIYVFGNQWHSSESMPTVQYHVPGAVEKKYLDWPRATLHADSSHWTIPNEIDSSSVDLSWVPDPGDPPYIYQFATQHQKTGGPIYTVPGATEVKYIDYITTEFRTDSIPIVEIDHLDGNAGLIPNVIKRIRYFDNYRDTLIRVANGLVGTHEFVWVCSSVCDYSNFDFSWHPEKWQNTMLHVFASDEQKFGDTFLLHVPTFAQRAPAKALLEWYSVNFVPISVPRRQMPVVRHNCDSHVDKVRNTDWPGPLALFTVDQQLPSTPAVNLWRSETKTIVPLSAGASTVIVPKAAIPHIKTQLYDYDYIDKSYRSTQSDSRMDIVFISYDEPEAEQNWQILHNKFPNSQRVHGVSGMELALESAADVSTTPWYWAVFAKTELAPNFDFEFVPDYMQQPKHYIFNCRNMVNDLEYGHMGIVLYNCQGIRSINRAGQFGLDYTLSFPHESISILSCLGRFNTTPYHTWRTAFRETAKLAFFEHQQESVEGQYRLSRWLTHAHGNYADWCLQGAKDGVEFFETTNANLDTLKQSFRWEWLRNYFCQRYGNLE